MDEHGMTDIKPAQNARRQEGDRCRRAHEMLEVEVTVDEVLRSGGRGGT